MKIAICGKMGSGKSYIAQNMETMFPGGWSTPTPMHPWHYIGPKKLPRYCVYSFAEKVKELSEELFNKKHKDRECLVELATKMREIDKDVWLNYTLNKIKDDEEEYVIIDDLRLTNEYERLVKEGWNIIKIQVDEETRIARLKNKYKEDFENHTKYFNSITENDVCCYPDNKFNLVIKNSMNPTEELVSYINSIENKPSPPAPHAFGMSDSSDDEDLVKSPRGPSRDRLVPLALPKPFQI
tara:strand:+ start:878 stop:1597 length:720 start_codon:yes stop_codon:yes gene_type:complete